MIFNDEVNADHVVMVDEIRSAVEAEKKRFPPEYRQSWQLTRLVAVYLVGQLARASTDPHVGSIISNPTRSLTHLLQSPLRSHSPEMTYELA